MRLALADDELLARQRLVRLLGELGDLEVVAAAASGEELLLALEEEPTDAVLLDVDMPGLDGLFLARRLAELAIPVIFVTAHPEHALIAFEVGAVDYVVKPVERERLAQALSRVRPSVAPASAGPIALPGGRGIRLLQLDELTHAEVDGSGVVVHTTSGPVHTEWSLAELERRLPPERFVRVHRRTLVALSAVEWLEGKDGAMMLRLRSGERVAISRGAGRALKRKLGV